jgi:hypothetical protein
MQPNMPEWTFRSTMTDPAGWRVTTVITVPVNAAWGDVKECGELAQMGAFRAAELVAKSRQQSLDKECPF